MFCSLPRAQLACRVGLAKLMRVCPLMPQDWTKLENEDAQGLVEITYRTGDEPGRPPDVQVIQKQMAIVAWQPGPNRTLKVPTEVSRTRTWSV